MTAYYNEIDPYAAQWLRNLIDAGHIAPGIVDERSIEDVYPSDLRGFTQCHFFAGIGVWSYALRRAGWGDDRPVWTGSCPCQPFSAAGAGAGFDDERHLWPGFFHLIAQCKPECVLGEQVASKDAEPWIDLVQADMEGVGYAVGAIPFPAAGVGAPHIRDRLYWVADANYKGLEGRRAVRQRGGERLARADGVARRMADSSSSGRGKERAHIGWGAVGDRAQRIAAGLVHGGGAGRVADVQRVGSASVQRDGHPHVVEERDDQRAWPGLEHGSSVGDAGPVNGFWRAADWLLCRDGRWRPVEPSTFPLAHGAPARVGRTRAYGNAINAEAAVAFIECVMEAA